MSQTTTPLTFEVTRRTDPRPDAEREAVLANPGFGTTFTDHMVTGHVDARARGGTRASVTAYGPLSRSCRRRRCCTTPRRSSRA